MSHFNEGDSILLLWEVPNHHILETLTSTDKLLGQICSIGKLFKIVTTIFGKSRVQNRTKKPKTQAAYSFGYSKQCEYLTTMKMQNVTGIDFLKIPIIMKLWRHKDVYLNILCCSFSIL